MAFSCFYHNLWLYFKLQSCLWYIFKIQERSSFLLLPPIAVMEWMQVSFTPKSHRPQAARLGRHISMLNPFTLITSVALDLSGACRALSYTYVPSLPFPHSTMSVPLCFSHFGCPGVFSWLSLDPYLRFLPSDSHLHNQNHYSADSGWPKNLLSHY